MKLVNIASLVKQHHASMQRIISLHLSLRNASLGSSTRGSHCQESKGGRGRGGGIWHKSQQLFAHTVGRIHSCTA